MFKLFYPLLKLPGSVSVLHGNIPVIDMCIIKNKYLVFVPGSWHIPPKTFGNS